jgi:hypothetical protein
MKNIFEIEEKMADQIKKAFNIPADLNSRWDAMHPSKKDHSVSGTAAILLWLALEDYPGLREQLRRMGQGTINAATIKKAKELLIHSILDQAIMAEIEKLGPEKMEFLRLLKQAAEQSSDDKGKNG